MRSYLDVAVLQLSSQSSVAGNLARVGELVGEAAARGARLVALPENFASMGGDAAKVAVAECIDTLGGPVSSALRKLAMAHNVYIVAGGLPELSGDSARPFNTSFMIAPGGSLAARYRKIHLFDVSLADGTVHNESASTSRGDYAPVISVVDGATIGLTICYDLRFPELFRALVDLGARIVTVPAAFTVTTGKDHWHTLLRARAIENQIFIVAPAQVGSHPGGRKTYGKSLIIDPWGDVIAQCGDRESIAVARLDFAYQDEVRKALPCLEHRQAR